MLHPLMTERREGQLLLIGVSPGGFYVFVWLSDWFKAWRFSSIPHDLVAQNTYRSAEEVSFDKEVVINIRDPENPLLSLTITPYEEEGKEKLYRFTFTTSSEHGPLKVADPLLNQQELTDFFRCFTQYWISQSG